MNETLARSTRKPGVYMGYDTRLAINNLPAALVKMLIVAQRTVAGSVAALVPTQVYSDADVATYFGSGSPAHLMARTALKANPHIDLTVIGQDDAAAGVAATGTVTIAGPATGPGVISLYVNARLIRIAVATDAVANDIAAALKAELDDHPDLPVTAAVNAAVVTLTTKVKGTFGNGIKLVAESTAAGATATVVAMSAGATDPDVTDALDVVFPVRYQVIACQYNDATNLDALKEHLDTVSGKIEQRGAMGYYGLTGALSAAVTLVAGRNAARLDTAYLRGTYSHPADLAAAFASHRAGVLAVDPALSLDGDELPGIHTPGISDRLSRTEQETCLHSGLTPLEVDQTGKVRIVRAITNYLVDEAGNPDESLLDDPTVTSLDYVRDFCKSQVQKKFPKAKLSSRLPARVRTCLYDALKKLETAEIVTDVDKYKGELVVERNDADPAGWLRARIPAPIVPGLHVLDGTIVLYL